ncbi:MAG: hypothetical protein LBO74_06020 [Candidatus Symbiothrix sp.]|jgi:hypothetical protein|nr:hypothetical protein [Candidatus Symbiothrix sp.]
MKKLGRILLLVIVVCMASNVSAQHITISHTVDSTKVYKVELQDSTAYIGRIIQKDSAAITVKTSPAMQVELPVEKIKNVSEIKPSDPEYIDQSGKKWFPNPNPANYLLGPSAFALKKKEGYYQNVYLFFNSVGIGLTDHIAVSAGIEILTTSLSLTDSDYSPLFFLTVKAAGYELADKFHAGGGLFYGGLGSEGGIFSAYGTGTYGSLDHNITCTIATAGSSDGDWLDAPILGISGLTRISRKVAFISENWFVPTEENGYVFSYGVRFLGEKISVDLAFLNNSEIIREIPIGIPFVGFVVKF